jgi:hypothetical protein
MQQKTFPRRLFLQALIAVLVISAVCVLACGARICYRRYVANRAARRGYSSSGVGGGALGGASSASSSAAAPTLGADLTLDDAIAAVEAAAGGARTSERGVRVPTKPKGPFDAAAADAAATAESKQRQQPLSVDRPPRPKATRLAKSGGAQGQKPQQGGAGDLGSSSDDANSSSNKRAAVRGGIAMSAVSTTKPVAPAAPSSAPVPAPSSRSDGWDEGWDDDYDDVSGLSLTGGSSSAPVSAAAPAQPSVPFSTAGGSGIAARAPLRLGGGKPRGVPTSSRLLSGAEKPKPTPGELAAEAFRVEVDEDERAALV